jgi:hypothetical protein
LVFGEYNIFGNSSPSQTIGGDVANDYGTKSNDDNVGVTKLKSGSLILNKANDTVAIPTARMYIGDPNDLGDSQKTGKLPYLIANNRNQFNPQCVVGMFASPDNYGVVYRADWISYASQTIGGLEAESTPEAVAAVALTPPSDDPARTVTLTIDNAVDHSFTGCLTGPGNLVKSGDGKQNLTLFVDANPKTDTSGPYTGTTTIDAGTLSFSGSKMTGGLLTLAGAVSGAGTLGVFDDGATPTVLQITAETNLANAVIGATDTLELASSTVNSIGNVAGDGTLHVTDGTTLISTSIAVDTLVIGGAPTTTPTATSVPEPGVLALLAIAGIAIAWFRLKK